MIIVIVMILYHTCQWYPQHDNNQDMSEEIYAIHEIMDQMNLEEATHSERMEEWMGHVEKTLDVLESVPNIEIVSRHRPWEL